VAGALEDHDRASIVGESSFGKGLVQSVYPLTEGTGLALTTALYYTPSGRSIQKPLDVGRFELASATAPSHSVADFRTDSGRRVTGGGGIVPDFIADPEPTTELRAALETSASFTTFATEYLGRQKVTADFEVSSAMLDDFELFLSQHNIRPGVNEWSAEREWIRSRLKQEIFNQALGVEKGDEVEAGRDPQVRKALEVIAH